MILEYPHPIERFILREDLKEISSRLGLFAPTTFVHHSSFVELSGLTTSDGWAAIVDIPSTSSWDRCHHMLVLDQIQDPGNMGTLIRSAAALGWDCVATTKGSVDPYNDKALRAAKGATFMIPVIEVSSDELIETWRQRHFEVTIADVQGKPFQQSTSPHPQALILGHETKGVGRWAYPHGMPMAIPMSMQTNSLNVSAAGAILLYALRPSI